MVVLRHGRINVRELPFTCSQFSRAKSQGSNALLKHLQNVPTVLGAQALGEATEAIESTIDYVKQRTAFGSALRKKLAIRHRLVRLPAHVEAAGSSFTTPLGGTHGDTAFPWRSR